MTTLESPSAVHPPRTRLFYLDLVRAIAAILIVITHFNNPYLAQGPYVLAMSPFGIYIGDLGVSLFLIISGAALMMTYGRKIDYKSFFWKRFKGIYPMFWIAWILATGFFIIQRQGYAINGGPPASIIYTILGVDGMAANFGIPTMYLLGEWFLGFIIIFYLVFPLLRWAVIKHPIVLVGIVAVLYLASLWYFQTPRGFPPGIILTTRLPELAFGMFLGYRWKRLPLWSAAPALFVLALWSFERPTDDTIIGTTLVGISCFTLLVVVAKYVDQKPVRRVVGLIAAYSYAIFLVHHVVIMYVFTGTDTSGFGRAQAYGLFAATSILIFGLSVALVKIEVNVVRFVTTMFEGVRLGRRGRRRPGAGSSPDGPTPTGARNEVGLGEAAPARALTERGQG